MRWHRLLLAAALAATLLLSGVFADDSGDVAREERAERKIEGEVRAATRAEREGKKLAKTESLEVKSRVGSEESRLLRNIEADDDDGNDSGSGGGSRSVDEEDEEEDGDEGSESGGDGGGGGGGGGGSRRAVTAAEREAATIRGLLKTAEGDQRVVRKEQKEADDLEAQMSSSEGGSESRDAREEQVISKQLREAEVASSAVKRDNAKEDRYEAEAEEEDREGRSLEAKAKREEGEGEYGRSARDDERAKKDRGEAVSERKSASRVMEREARATEKAANDMESLQGGIGSDEGCVHDCEHGCMSKCMLRDSKFSCSRQCKPNCRDSCKDPEEKERVDLRGEGGDDDDDDDDDQVDGGGEKDEGVYRWNNADAGGNEGEDGIPEKDPSAQGPEVQKTELKMDHECLNECQPACIKDCSEGGSGANCDSRCSAKCQDDCYIDDGGAGEEEADEPQDAPSGRSAQRGGVPRGARGARGMVSAAFGGGAGEDDAEGSESSGGGVDEEGQVPLRDQAMSHCMGKCYGGCIGNCLSGKGLDPNTLPLMPVALRDLMAVVKPDGSRLSRGEAKAHAECQRDARCPSTCAAGCRKRLGVQRPPTSEGGFDSGGRVLLPAAERRGDEGYADVAWQAVLVVLVCFSVWTLYPYVWRYLRKGTRGAPMLPIGSTTL